MDRKHGIGLLTILFVVFLVLKLTGQIDWSWWWVTAPLWGQFLIAFLVVAVILAAGAGGSKRDSYYSHRRRPR